jgi:hypothetical protein
LPSYSISVSVSESRLATISGRTNTDLNPLEAMLCYKQLWTVEQTFRTAKHLLSTRPIFHISSTRPSAVTCSAAFWHWC